MHEIIISPINIPISREMMLLRWTQLFTYLGIELSQFVTYLFIGAASENASFPFKHVYPYLQMQSNELLHHILSSAVSVNSMLNLKSPFLDLLND
jgi:hypothetical protein